LDGSTIKAPSPTVVDHNGLEGTFADWPAAKSEQMQLVLFQNGERVLVPRELLSQQSDGRYLLMASIEELLSQHGSLPQSQMLEGQTLEARALEDQPLIVPVTAERVTVHKRVVEKGRVQIYKSVHERTEVVDEPLLAEEVEIERVPINRMIDEPLSIRYEGDTTIIPLLEEVLVIEKRLVLREEVHIKKLQTVVHNPQQVSLREEQVDIVRKPANGHTD
jgi:uncharacterized protein (TIGR02271 family)